MEQFKCLNELCKHEWEGKPGPGAPCQKCGSKYYEWVSFKHWDLDEDTKTWKKSAEKEQPSSSS